MKTRTSKALGVAFSAAAIALSVPLAVNAYAEPAAPVAEIPDPQGPECGAFKEALPNWKGLADLPVSTVLSSIPDISTFNSAISGQLNPAVNITSVLDNGPYVVFAPTNEAFAAQVRAFLDEIVTEEVHEHERRTGDGFEIAEADLRLRGRQVPLRDVASVLPRAAGHLVGAVTGRPAQHPGR